MEESQFAWTVIGAGPAGILSVGKLLDQGIQPNDILWVDPFFQAGDLGSKWSKVSSNTKVKLFLRYLNGCRSFQFNKAPSFSLCQLDPEDTCILNQLVDPLQWLTDNPLKDVQRHRGIAENLRRENGYWKIVTVQKEFFSSNVILTIGSDPKTLPFKARDGIISLEDALNIDKLKKRVDPSDCIGVFGASHSSVLVIKSLLELGVEVMNFYTHPLKYAVYLDDDTILFDDTGLKGCTAKWAKENIDGKWPEGLQRILIKEETLATHLKGCNKLIFTVGFQKRGLPKLDQYTLAYNPYTGIIAPGLFGFGIAFPQKNTDRFGITEERVGLAKFLRYIDQIMPLWLKYSG